MRHESRDASALVGRRLGEFVIREPLSSGGFGLVFRAEQPALAREAVIKVLHARLRGSETVIQRFLREARLASRLDHPFAAHIYAFGAEPDGLMWIAMELVRGTPLDRLLEAKGPVSLERFVPLLERICQVVQTAHDQGIVHRDLKPANIMVLVRAGQLLPKLLDLGIAKLDEHDPASSGPKPALQAAASGGVSGPATSLADTAAAGADMLADTAAVEPSSASSDAGSSGGRLTEHGAVMGSPLYMAPEQWMDAGASDARTDIYALGVLSYEALTGKPPFTGSQRMEIAMAHARSKPPKLGGELPVALDAVIARALAKTPEGRFASALELATAFRAASGLAEEDEGLPRFDDAVRAEALTRAPRPIAAAVSALHAARNAHQARDALWQLVRVAARMIGVTALAAHAHVGARRDSDPSIAEGLRRLRSRTLPDGDWLALARDLCAPFRDLRAAYPIPELIDLVERTDSALSELIALALADAGGSDAQVREQLATAMPKAARLLSDELAFFNQYQLVVPLDVGVVGWVGLGADARVTTRGPALALRQPAFVDPTGVPVISLWPFVQLLAPAPGVADQLFFLEGRGRRGARMTALPDVFELEDEALWEAVGGLVQDFGRLSSSSDEEVCPYPGLSAFTSGDAARFFGRERETEAVANRLRAQALLAIVGPSGAGKSSFVQAGVIPALGDDARVVTVRPGASPLVNLCARMSNVCDPDQLLEGLRHDPDTLGHRLRSRATAGMTVIVVDQFEELFTLCDDPAERELFADALVRAARSADESVRVVITMRDDFLLHAERVAALRSRLAPALHLLTTPGPAELRRILTEPLRLAGYELDDPKLADDMIEALADARSPLALLSFTCSKLWELRDRRFRQIARKAYASLGGVAGALAQHAERTLAAMRPEQQRLVREVFRHAITADGTRTILGRDELERVLGADAAARAVLESLISARLLVSSDGPAGREQIELTHEALILAWPRLVTWRREDAEGARLRDQLRVAAKQWDERGRPTGLLWRGDALAEYRLWRARYVGNLPVIDEEFATASLADAARATRRRRVAMGSALGVLSVGVIALLVLNARVARQRGLAEDNEQRATASATEAKEAAGKLQANLTAQYEDQGRRYLLEGNPLPALAYLDKARELGAAGPAHELVAAFAARAVGTKRHELNHTGNVHGLTMSPDGRDVALADLGVVRLWDVASGRQRLELEHDAKTIRFSRDGTQLVSAGNDGVAIVWERQTGRRIAALGEEGEGLQLALLAPDARHAVSIGADDTVRLWELPSGRLRATLHAEAHPPAELLLGTPAAFSPDGTLVAAGDNRGAIRVWSVARGALVTTNVQHAGQINEVRFTPDGKHVLAASNDATASMIDARTGRRVWELRHQLRINTLELSPDGRYVATGSNDRTAALWDLRTGAPVRSFAGHDGGVNTLAFRHDGVQLATGSDDRRTIVWDLATGRREARLIGHKAAVFAVAFTPSGTTLATAANEPRALLWEPRAQVAARRIAGHAGSVYSVDFSPDGRRVISGGGDGATLVWDRHTGKQLFEIKQTMMIRRARFSPDGTRIAVGGAEGVVRVYDAANGALVRELVGHEGRVQDLQWFPDSQRLATASLDGTARVWSVDGAPPIVYREHTGTVTSISIARTGDLLVSSAYDGTVHLWGTDGRTRARWERTLMTADLDPSGTFVLGNSGTAVQTWRVADGKAGVELLDTGDLLSARWSRDGNFITTASVDATIRIWDGARGDLLAVLGHDDHVPVYTATFSQDGRAIATGSQDGSLTIWELPEPVTDLATLVRCGVPYRVESNGLVQVETDPTCAKPTR